MQLWSCAPKIHNLKQFSKKSYRSFETQQVISIILVLFLSSCKLRCKLRKTVEYLDNFSLHLQRLMCSYTYPLKSIPSIERAYLSQLLILNPPPGIAPQSYPVIHS